MTLSVVGGEHLRKLFVAVALGIVLGVVLFFQRTTKLVFVVVLVSMLNEGHCRCFRC